jgi:hypothetical protein
LAENHADLGSIDRAFLVGRTPKHGHSASCRHKNPRHHLDHGGFAGAVGAEITDRFACIDVESDAGHSANLGELAAEKAAKGAR